MPDLQQMKILVVDDDQVSRQLFKKILEKAGYNHIETCASGEEALALINNSPPDVVLLDIMMPGIDGYEVCRRIRADETTRLLPVVMVTGGPEDADEVIKKSYTAGATDYITKPIRSLEFTVRIRSALTIKQAYDRMNAELNKRRQLEKEREQVILELKEALVQVKTLGGMLPMCASCKKIRDDKGYWTQVEAYIQDHSEAQFSHGICPECAKKLYPELGKK
jgi:CheY-like chemotaxis protein